MIVRWIHADTWSWSSWGFCYLVILLYEHRNLFFHPATDGNLCSSQVSALTPDCILISNALALFLHCRSSSILFFHASYQSFKHTFWSTITDRNSSSELKLNNWKEGHDRENTTNIQLRRGQQRVLQMRLRHWHSMVHAPGVCAAACIAWECIRSHPLVLLRETSSSASPLASL